MDIESAKANIFRWVNLGLLGLSISTILAFSIFNTKLHSIAIGSGCYSIISLFLHFSAAQIPDLKVRVRILLSAWIGIVAYLTYCTGGIQGPMPGVFAPLPLLALIFVPLNETIGWVLLIIATLFTLTLFSTPLEQTSIWSQMFMDSIGVLGVFVVGIIQHTFSNAHRKATEEARAQLLQNSHLAALGEMSAGVAHEINNPLCIISIKLSQLQQLSKQEKLTPAMLDDGLSKTRAACERITKIVEGLKTYARDSSKDDFEPAAIQSIIEDTLNLAQERLRDSDISLQIDSVPEDLLIDCKKVQIAQVLINLINNSYDAIKNLSEKWIRIIVEEQDKQVTIRFIDSGPGIAPEIADKIMQPFFTTKPLGEGSGLGLSISHGIIKSHHGEFLLDRTATHTCFIIQLPKHQETHT